MSSRGPLVLRTAPRRPVVPLAANPTIDLIVHPPPIPSIRKCEPI